MGNMQAPHLFLQELRNAELPEFDRKLLEFAARFFSEEENERALEMIQNDPIWLKRIIEKLKSGFEAFVKQYKEELLPSPHLEE